MIILLHSSKTMRSPKSGLQSLGQPQLLDEAEQLMKQLKKLSPEDLAKVMHISMPLAIKTKKLTDNWSSTLQQQSAAIDSFVGDIYSGLQVNRLSPGDRAYANQHLIILSGLYGALRPLDGICPYRLEMAYKLPGLNLYDFWGSKIAKCLPKNQVIINTSSEEYTQAVLPHIKDARVITPKFMTLNNQTGQPVFVVVHAKIARGAYARWLIVNRIDSENKLAGFNEIGYEHSAKLSKPNEPVYVAKEFGGKGLSMRLNTKV